MTFVVENGTTLLKEIYKRTKNDSIKVRALVGLCKLGASHGTDVSRRVFAEGNYTNVHEVFVFSSSLFISDIYQDINNYSKWLL